MQAVSAAAPAVVSTGNWLVDKSYRAYNRVKGGLNTSPHVSHHGPLPAADNPHDEIEFEVRIISSKNFKAWNPHPPPRPVPSVDRK